MSLLSAFKDKGVSEISYWLFKLTQDKGERSRGHTCVTCQKWQWCVFDVRHPPPTTTNTPHHTPIQHPLHHTLVVWVPECLKQPREPLSEFISEVCFITRSEPETCHELLSLNVGVCLQWCSRFCRINKTDFVKNLPENETRSVSKETTVSGLVMNITKAS